MRRAMETGVLSAYVAAGAAAAGLAVALGRDPLTTTSWVGLHGGESVGWSLVLGGILAAGTVLSSRVLCKRTRWARDLHVALRPAIRDADGVSLACMAVASGVGEELLFRGLLVPMLGVLASSVAFGLLHQVRGPARWVWAGWAFVVGGLLALIFAITGSLAGAIVAHVVINGANLRFIRDVDPDGRGGDDDEGPRLAAWLGRSARDSRSSV